MLREKLFFRVFSLFLFFALSCSSPHPTEKKVFHLNISAGYLGSLDPAFAKEISTMWASHMIYNTLVETDGQLRTTTSLARTWDVSADGLHYLFHLRTDVYFQDDAVFPNGKGRKMVAADVVYSFGRLLDPKTASPGAWIFNDRMASVQPFVALNDSTVQINLRTPFRPLPQMLAMQYCSIVPHEAAGHWGKDFRSHPCGTGPFRFSYWDEGNALCLLRNEHYWEKDSAGKQLPYLDAVQFSFADSKATEFLLFMQGKVDFVNNIDGSFKDLVLTKRGTLKDEYRDKMNLEVSPYLNTEYIGFLFDSSRESTLMRRAISYAIDRQKIITYFKNGVGIPATKGFIPAGLPGYDSVGTYGYTYDPAKALQLLEQAGYPHGQGLQPIHIMIPSNYEDIVNFIAGELKEVGITLTIETMQPNVLKQQMSSGKAQAFRAQWLADYPDAETYLVCFNSNFPAPPNYTRFHNTSFDEMYAQSLSLPDSERYSIYTRMDSLVMSYAPVVPLYYEKLLHFTRKNISGFSSNAMNIIELKRVQKH